MKKTFICLANSKKHGERCLAGIEVSKGKKGFNIVRVGGEPKWIRPVSNTEFGEVHRDLVRHIRLLDIIEIEMTEACPDGYQSENVYFDPTSLQVIRTGLTLSAKNLDLLCKTSCEQIFDSFSRSIAQKAIVDLDHSLLFLKVEYPKLYYKSFNRQLRCDFVYQHHEYDLPITDIDFIMRYATNTQLLAQAQHVYLCLSIGVAFEGFHYKLIAGVVTV